MAMSVADPPESGWEGKYGEVRQFGSPIYKLCVLHWIHRMEDLSVRPAQRRWVRGTMLLGKFRWERS